MRITHIYWFAHYNMLGPCTRYRGKYVVEEIFKTYRIPYTFVYPSYKPLHLVNFIKIYLMVLFFRKKDSIIVFQKTYTIGLYSNLLKILLFLRSKNTYYDIDDAYYVKFPPGTIIYFIKNCKTCITGSQSLAEYAKKYSNSINNIFTLSSPILVHNNIKTKSSDFFTIGWVGFYNYHRDSLLQLLFPAIQKLDFELKLVILGIVKEEHFNEVRDYFKEKENVKLELPSNIDWLNEDVFYKQVMTFDVGVSPLLVNEINIAKSAFKLKQYLSSGVPVIGSSTGENSIVFQEGDNGYIANSPNEYFEFLNKMYNMPEKERYIMRLNARESVRKFEIDKYCSDFLSIIEKTKT